MRILLACLLVVAACGGGKPKTSPTPEPKQPAADPVVTPFATDYCDSYRGCAEERVRMDASAEGAEPDEAMVAEQATALQEQCRAVTSGLTPGQESWLSSCTGCGGSCDVYDCMDRVPPEATPPAFVCDMGE
jgi:hypothetical protein